MLVNRGASDITNDSVISIGSILSNTFFFRLAIAVLFSISPIVVSGHPAVVLHSHSEDKVLWELDASRDGDTAHNHINLISFGGVFQQSREPYSAIGCWDNNVWRANWLALFTDKGHCFIDVDDPINRVTYSFDGSWDSEAMARVQQAIDRYNDLAAFTTFIIPHGIMGRQIGVEFEEVGSGGVIEIRWTTSFPGAWGLGKWIPVGTPGLGGGKHVLYFNSNPLVNQPLTMIPFEGWDFAGVPTDEDDTKWHFLTVALHEVGHMVGLLHQNDSGDLMQSGSSGISAPATNPGRDTFYDIDFDRARGVYELYGSTPELGQPPEDDFFLFFLTFCFGGYEPVSDLTFAIPGLHLSYRQGSPTLGFCWGIAAEGSQ